MLMVEDAGYFDRSCCKYKGWQPGVDAQDMIGSDRDVTIG